jgi:thiol-disulfide isomerase/thioredoxin
MATAKYVNFNLNQGSGLPIGDNTSGIFSRIKNAGSKLNTTTSMVIVAVILFSIISLFYYYYYIAPKMNAKYHPNSEKVPIGSGNGNIAELLFFYTDWCPHCKTAKPIWNDLKSEYQDKTKNGYKVIFTDINCSEETAEVDKMMNQYGIEGYPTIKLLKDGQIIEYDAKPSKETLTQFLNTVL